MTEQVQTKEGGKQFKQNHEALYDWAVKRTRRMANSLQGVQSFVVLSQTRLDILIVHFSKFVGSLR